jgi:predicted  nucleic acid-binding Zn-ribbon protein
MAMSSRKDPEQALERSADELEERLGKLEEHIEDAERKADEQRPEEMEEQLPAGAQPPEGGDEPPTVEGRRDED